MRTGPEACSTYCDAQVAQPEQPVPFRLRHPRQNYMENVEACKEALYNGESYEVLAGLAISARPYNESPNLYPP